MGDGPRGLQNLDGRPIINMSVERLIASAIANIIVLAGYLRRLYDVFARRFSDAVRTLQDLDCLKLGSKHSLFCARNNAEPSYGFQKGT